MDVPLCPTCSQPATTAFTGTGWECRNEACPEFGQLVRADEPRVEEPAHPGRPLAPDEPRPGER